MKRVWLDTNVIIRLIVEDDKNLLARADRVSKRARAGEFTLYVPLLVVAEAVWALGPGYYKQPLAEVATSLHDFLTSEEVEAEELDLCLSALHDMSVHNVSFPDAFLAAASYAGGEELFSFDESARKRLKSRLLDES